ncbi:hypothetical protein SLE2022_386290 [Rubroshorea leprosula]
MAFLSKVANILRQTASNQIINAELSSSKSKASIFQAIRCFSSMASSKLFVGGLSYGTDDYQLKEAFSKYGQVIEARVIVDRETGRSRGFGFVTYTSSEEASSAIQALDGQALHGRNIRVNYATERAPRNFGGGGFNPNYGGSAGGFGGNFGGGNYGPPSGNYGGNAGYGGGGAANTFGSQGNYSGNFGDGGYGSNTNYATDSNNPDGNAYADVAGGVGNNYAGTGEGSGLEGGADFEFGKGDQRDSSGNNMEKAREGSDQNDAVDGNYRDDDNGDFIKRE